MATKKQKREAAIAKREAYMAKVQAEGLAAQQADHARRKIEEEELSAIAKRLNQRYNAILANAGIVQSDETVGE